METYQYTVISEPSKGKFYPLWREKEGDVWKGYMHTVMNKGKRVVERVSFYSREEALQFNRKQSEMVTAQHSLNWKLGE